RSVAAAVDLHVRRDEWSQQPRPYGPLVVRAVALGRTAGVASTVLRITRREATQSIRREQVFLQLPHHAPGPFRRQHGVRQADGEDLIRTDGCIGQSGIYDI